MPYSSFYSLRARLTAELGYVLEMMEGFNDVLTSGQDRGFATKINTTTLVHPFIPIPWRVIKNPIVGMIFHSDHNGELTVEECVEIAPELRRLSEPWDDDDYDKIHALALAEAMDLAVEANEPLEFH